jgi:hypothetical protein
MNEMITDWTEKYTTISIIIARGMKLQMLLLADDHIIISNSVDNLQKVIYNIFTCEEDKRM